MAQFKGMTCFSYEASTQSYLKADSSIDCNGAEHQTFIIYNSLMIIFYQSIILFYFNFCTPTSIKSTQFTRSTAMPVQLYDTETWIALSIIFAFCSTTRVSSVGIMKYLICIAACSSLAYCHLLRKCQ